MHEYEAWPNPYDNEYVQELQKMILSLRSELRVQWAEAHEWVCGCYRGTCCCWPPPALLRSETTEKPGVQ